MKNFTATNNSSKMPRWLRILADMWRWLIEPSPAIVEPVGRLQARILMAMLLVVLTLGLLSLTLSALGFYTPPGESKTRVSVFDWITLSVILLLAIEYGLSRSVHFPLAASLAVATVLGATFAMAIINPDNLQFLYFLILGGLISGLFLSARATTIVFVVTFIGLLLLPTFAAGFSNLNNINAL